MNSTWLDGQRFVHPPLLKLLSWPWPKSLRFSIRVVGSQSEGAGPLRHSIELWLPLDRSVWCGNKQTTPTNSGHALGHWFHVVRWHLTFSVNSALNLECRRNSHLLLHFYNSSSLSSSLYCWACEFKGQPTSCPSQLVYWVDWEDSVWVTQYDAHEFPSLISVLIL